MGTPSRRGPDSSKCSKRLTDEHDDDYVLCVSGYEYDYGCGLNVKAVPAELEELEELC